jgi:hypothetical protein
MRPEIKIKIRVPKWSARVWRAQGGGSGTQEAGIQQSAGSSLRRPHLRWRQLVLGERLEDVLAILFSIAHFYTYA